MGNQAKIRVRGSVNILSALFCVSLAGTTAAFAAEGDPSGQTGGSGTKGIAELVVPCEEQLQTLANDQFDPIPEMNTCARAFGKCKRVIASLNEGVVKHVLGQRVNLLYKGYNAISPDLASPSQIWGDTSQNSAYACNLSCGEGAIQARTSKGDSFEAVPSYGSVLVPPAVDASKDTVTSGPASCGSWGNGDDGASATSDDSDPEVCVGNDSGLVWNDGSEKAGIGHGKGGGGCAGAIGIDFSQATAIGAADTGALVQAHWWALDQVLQELKKGSLTFHGGCMKIAGDTRKTIKNVAKLLSQGGYCTDYNVQGASGPSGTSGTSGPSGAWDPIDNLTCVGNTNRSAPPTQRDCYLRSAIDLAESGNFVTAAECEVYHRANKAFTEAFIDVDSSLHRGPLRLLQIRNKAIEDCTFKSVVDNDSDSFPGDQVAGNNNENNGAVGDHDHGEGIQHCFPRRYQALYKAYLDEVFPLSTLQKGGFPSKEYPGMGLSSELQSADPKGLMASGLDLTSVGGPKIPTGFDTSQLPKNWYNAPEYWELNDGTTNASLANVRLHRVGSNIDSTGAVTDPTDWGKGAGLEGTATPAFTTYSSTFGSDLAKPPYCMVRDSTPAPPVPLPNVTGQ